MPSITASIVISCYNARSAGEQVIEAALATTGPDCEFLLVDNHSPSAETREYVAQLAGTPRVRVLDPGRNLGPHEGFRFGLHQARGRYVIRLDDDVIPTPGWCDALVRALSEHPSIAYLALPLNSDQASPVPGPHQFIVDGKGYRVKIVGGKGVVLFGCIALPRQLCLQHFNFPQPKFYSAVEEQTFADRARILRRHAGYLISHRARNLSRTEASDPLYEMWKVLCARQHASARAKDYGAWRARWGFPGSGLDAGARRILLDFGYRPEQVRKHLGL